MFIRIRASDGSVSALEVTEFDWVKWQSNGCMVLAGGREKAQGIAVPVNRTYLFNGCQPNGIDLPMAEEITETEYLEIIGEYDPENIIEEQTDTEPESSLSRRELTEIVKAQADALAKLTEKVQELMK